MTDFVAGVALVVSVIDLLIHACEAARRCARLRIVCDAENSFFVSFVAFGTYHCAVLKVCLNNPSEAPIAISSAYIRAFGKEHHAGHFKGADIDNSSGITLYSGEEKHFYNIKSENVLDSPTVEGCGFVKGYLYFPLERQVFPHAAPVTLIIDTPRRRFSKRILLSPPSNGKQPKHIPQLK